MPPYVWTISRFAKLKENELLYLIFMLGFAIARPSVVCNVRAPYTVNPKGVGVHPQGWSILHTVGCKYAPSPKGV